MLSLETLEQQPQADPSLWDEELLKSPEYFDGYERARARLAIGATVLDLCSVFGLDEDLKDTVCSAVFDRLDRVGNQDEVQGMFTDVLRVIGTTQTITANTEATNSCAAAIIDIRPVKKIKKQPKKQTVKQPKTKKYVPKESEGLTEDMTFHAPREAMENQEIIDFFLPADKFERSTYIRDFCRRFNNQLLIGASRSRKRRNSDLTDRAFSFLAKLRQSDNLSTRDLDAVSNSMGLYLEDKKPVIYKMLYKDINTLKTTSLSADDLASEGFIGLIQAAERYDLGKDDAKFWTFASIRIKGAAVDTLRNKSSLVHTPRSVIDTYNSYRFLNSQGLSDEEAAEQIGIPLTKLHAVIQTRDNNRALSLDRTMNADDEDDSTFSDALASTDLGVEEQVVGQIDAIESRNALLDAISKLKTREADILMRYYGLGNYEEPQKQLVIGAHYGVTESRINQLKKKALGDLSKILSISGAEI